MFDRFLFALSWHSLLGRRPVRGTGRGHDIMMRGHRKGPERGRFISKFPPPGAYDCGAGSGRSQQSLGWGRRDIGPWLGQVRVELGHTSGALALDQVWPLLSQALAWLSPVSAHHADVASCRRSLCPERPIRCELASANTNLDENGFHRHGAPGRSLLRSSLPSSVQGGRNSGLMALRVGGFDVRPLAESESLRRMPEVRSCTGRCGVCVCVCVHTCVA